jgi:hypothetical protein
MPWITKEWPVTQSDFVVAGVEATPYCEHHGCQEVARVRFTSTLIVMGDDGSPDRRESKIRSTLRCLAHAATLRADMAAKQGTPPIVDPGAVGEPAEPPKPKRKPLVYAIPPETSMAMCSSCGAGIHWVTTAAGKSMPVDAYDPTKGQPHWGSCKFASQHKKKR